MKLNTKFKQGEKVVYDTGEIIGFGIIKGVAAIELPIFGHTYIIEDLKGNVPNETYPYNHFLCTERHLEKY